MVKEVMSVALAAQSKLSGDAAEIPCKCWAAIKPVAADFACACGSPLNENAQTADDGVLRGSKKLIYLVLGSGFLRLGRRNGAVRKVRVG